jgi:Ca2+/Na+ antiporter
MRILLFLYVIIFLTLNFLVEGDLILLMAMSTFPVSLYLLLRKPRSKRKQKRETIHTPETASAQKEKSFEG